MRSGRGAVQRLCSLARAVALVGGIGVAPLGAQSSAAPGEQLKVSVLTWGPGDLVFERFGHNAIRVQNLATGTDLAYNWGMFDFDQPGFLRRFLSGDTRYWVEAFPTEWMVRLYAEQDRESVEQDLDLTPAERVELAAFVANQALEENRYYRYEYFRDNCSTRVRDVLDRVLGGSLQRRFTPLRTEWTYRSESVRLTGPTMFSQAGIDIALGPRADVPLSAWEAMFIPMRLRDFLRDVTVPSADGGTKPLVKEERVLHVSQRIPEPTERRGLTIGAWGPVLGAWMLLLAPVSAAARRRTRIPAAVMAVLFYGLTGLVGLAVLGMWIGSAHVFWYENLGLLLFSPLALLAAFPAARAILRGSFTPLAKWLVACVAICAMLAAVLAPLVSQRLGGPLLLVLPAHIGLAIAIFRHTRPAREPAP